QRFCVFKGEESGQLYVLDAYCPHLGADLTVGGKVRGDCIECPFHGWLANGNDGTCVRGPGNDPKKEKPQVPSFVTIRKWNSCEANGHIFVWHHAESEEQEPSWQMPIVDEIQTGKWVYRGRTEHVVRCHIQEIPENGADINHLEQLHSASVLLGCNWMDTNSWLNIVNHHWDPEWSRDENQPHIAKIKLGQMTTILGFNIPFSMLDIDIQQVSMNLLQSGEGHLSLKLDIRESSTPREFGRFTSDMTPRSPHEIAALYSDLCNVKLRSTQDTHLISAPLKVSDCVRRHFFFF
ncbi:Cholesterol 7-desaturase, partial [Araneus ventricosus]